MSNKSGSPKFLVPVFNPFQKFVYVILVALWFAALLNLWQWWFQPEHISSPVGMFITSILIVWVSGLPAYFFFFAYRAKRPNPALHLAEGEKGRHLKIGNTPSEKVATRYPVTPYHQQIPFLAVVTHAPSEGVDIAIDTLNALIQIRRYYPLMGIYLASEDCGQKQGQEAMARLVEFCQHHNVTISCRLGLESYHRDSFPRRTRSKEGNLSYFYDFFVFSNPSNPFKFALQFDIDHVPTLGYVSAILHAFDDPQVGYVSAPSICDKNRNDSWWVMPRAIVEATLHGILQAGYNGGWAPMAIGSHYAVRIEALKNLVHPIRKSFWNGAYTFHKGGVGPELAEDHSTSLAMNANGWKGIHAFDAIAYGDGPASFMDAMVQEQQWSRSLTQVLLKWTAGYFRLGNMPKHIMGEFLFSQAWYPIFALQMLIGFLIPVVSLWSNTPAVSMNYGQFLLHSIPTVFFCLLPIWWLKRCGALRPIDVPLMSLQTLLFQIVRWPWALLGVLEGFIGSVVLNRELSFRVTPKGVTGAQPLPLKAVFPYMVIVLMNLVTVLLVENPGHAGGYYYFCLLTGLIYLTVILAIVGTHLKENSTKPGYSLAIAWKPILVGLFLVTFSGVALVQRGPEALSIITGWRIGMPTPIVEQEMLESPESLSQSIANSATDTPNDTNQNP